MIRFALFSFVNYNKVEKLFNLWIEKLSLQQQNKKMSKRIQKRKAFEVLVSGEFELSYVENNTDTGADQVSRPNN